MSILLISADPGVREVLAVGARSVGRTTGEPVEFLEAGSGLQGIRLAWRHLPEVVITDEILSRAGGFAITRDLKGADPPFPGPVIILLERREDEWLAAWAGADAWFVKPVNPFRLAETVGGLIGAPREEAV